MASLQVKLRTATDDGHNTTRTHDLFYNIIKANDQERADQDTTPYSQRALFYNIVKETELDRTCTQHHALDEISFTVL